MFCIDSDGYAASDTSSARNDFAAAAYAAALASIVPHLLFGQAVLARYHVIPFALCFVAIALTLLGSRVRRAPASQQAA
jgi:hypothetical protein